MERSIKYSIFTVGVFATAILLSGNTVADTINSQLADGEVSQSCKAEATGSYAIDSDLLNSLSGEKLFPKDSKLPVVTAGLGEAVTTLYAGSTLPLGLIRCIQGQGLIYPQANIVDRTTHPRFDFVLADSQNPFRLPDQGHISATASHGRVVFIDLFEDAAGVDQAIGRATEIEKIIDQAGWPRITNDAKAVLYSSHLKKSYTSIAEMRQSLSNTACADTDVLFAVWQRDAIRIEEMISRLDLTSDPAKPGCHPIPQIEQDMKMQVYVGTIYVKRVPGKEAESNGDANPERAHRN